MTLFIFQSMPSLWTHSGFLHGREAEQGPAELEDTMLQESQLSFPRQSLDSKG